MKPLAQKQVCQKQQIADREACIGFKRKPGQRSSSFLHSTDEVARQQRRSEVTARDIRACQIPSALLLGLARGTNRASATASLRVIAARLVLHSCARRSSSRTLSLSLLEIIAVLLVLFAS